MKKTLVSTLTLALVVGAASTTFAAANPFSDVPADHWAYDAVAQLAKDGVIEGYGDGTYQGQNSITRYEMAQMVAKAMAKEDQANAADKAMIDKLAAEFSDELNNLGVRVSNLEKKVDNVKFTGEVRYTGARNSIEHQSEYKNKTNELLFRLEPTVTINNHWTAKARIDYSTDASTSANNNKAIVDRAWAIGQYGAMTYELGKIPLYTEQGLVFDSKVSGAQITATGKKLSGTITAGRYNMSDDNDWSVNNFYQPTAEDPDNANKTASFWGIGLNYKANQKFSAALGYYNASNREFMNDQITAGFNAIDASKGTDSSSYMYKADSAKIWNLGMTYNFTPKVSLAAAYAKNTQGEADGAHKKAYNIEVNYGKADPANKGSFGVYAAYRYLGAYATLHPTYDGAMAGTKGWEIGTQYTFAKNVLGTIRYFNGKVITSGGDTANKVSRIFGRIEFFF